MPELPDLTVYQEQLLAHLGGCRLEEVRIGSPFLLRSVIPPPDEAVGRYLGEVELVGKRLALGFAPLPDEAVEGPWLVIHLMIAGRLRLTPPGKAPKGGKNVLLELPFTGEEEPVGTLTLTEMGSKKRASLHVVADREGLRELDRGGVDPLGLDLCAFTEVLQREDHTLKRTLTDPRLFAGIGNAYSDEILWAAQLSPTQRTPNLDGGEIKRLFTATQETLQHWIAHHRELAGDAFPDKVTAFHPDMAVHGRYGKPCPRCTNPVQRIRYASNEANYCATCQTSGKLLADRALSRLMRGEWPKTLAEMEERKRG